MQSKNKNNSFAISKEKNHVLKLLRERGIEEKTFHHGTRPFHFKWARFRFDDPNSSIPIEFKSLLRDYLTYLMSGSDFGIFLPDKRNFSCSSFKLKYLKHNIKRDIYDLLLKRRSISEFNANTSDPSIPSCLIQMFDSINKIEDYMEKHGESNDERHNKLGQLILFDNKNTLAIEMPIWDRSTYITGHIDLILYDTSDIPTILVVDYKPNIDLGQHYNFVKPIPQVCMYGLLLRKVLNFSNNFKIKCAIINRERGILFNPDLILDLPKIIEKYYNPTYFLRYTDIFGDVQDYQLISWSILSRLQGLHDSRINDFLTSIGFELSRLLNLNTNSFIEIGNAILGLIQNLKQNCSASQFEELNEIAKATHCLFNLNYKRPEQDVLMDFFRQFQFDTYLWADNLDNAINHSLQILHSLQKLCYIFSYRFKTRMIGYREAYKEYLMYFYFVSRRFTDKKYFSQIEITHITNRDSSSFDRNLRHLVNFGLVKQIGFGSIKPKGRVRGSYCNIYDLTKKGLIHAKIILRTWKLNFPKEFNKWRIKFKKLHDFSLKKEVPIFDIKINREFDYNKHDFISDINLPRIEINEKYFKTMGWKRYLIIINYIVEKKREGLQSYREPITFTTSEINSMLGDSISKKITLDFMRKLFDLGYIEKSIQSGFTGGNIGFYWMTDKGKEEAMNLPALDQIIINREDSEDFDIDVYNQIQNINKSEILLIDDSLFTNNRKKMYLILIYYITDGDFQNIFSAVDISRITGLSNVNILRNLHQLERDGYIKLNHKKGQKYFYNLTQKGKVEATHSPSFEDMITTSIGHTQYQQRKIKQ